MSRNKTLEFFDAYAGDFDAIYGTKNTLLNRFVNTFFRGSMRERYVKVVEGCNPLDGCTVLDIGCGPGHYSVTLAKRGAASVTGVDFAESMLNIAEKYAEDANVQDKCNFILKDFMTFTAGERFDYTIAVGFMDYIKEPEALVDKVMSLTSRKAFFSFPVAGGFLAWQRKQRYKSRCDLYLYTEKELDDLFSRANCRDYTIEKIGRDYFVTAVVQAAA
jgi:cyclopropane fatty-acyl-phospholipid synthase-like methyltransferase